MIYVVMPSGYLQWMPNTLQAVGLIKTYRKMGLDPECMMETVVIDEDDIELRNEQGECGYIPY